MKRLQLILIIALFASISLAQNSINEALRQIEANNPSIKAMQAQGVVIKAEARAESRPPNPILEGGRFPAMQGAGVKYAWGVSQHFDFPSVYAKRSQLARTTDQYANAYFNSVRQEVLLEAKLTILELIHQKRLLNEYQQREAFAKTMLAIIQKKVDAGHTTAMELNNARLRVAESAQNVREAESNLRIISQRLFALNGMEAIIISDTTIILSQLPEKEQLAALFRQNDSRFLTLSHLVEVAESNRTLVNHQGLPEISIGYESERTDAEHFAGFRAGITIPLWGNSGKKRAATMQLNAARLESHAQKLMLENEFEELYIKALNTKHQLDDLKKAFESFSNIALLRRALEAGQVSVIDFFNEITFLYDITDRVLELELNYLKLYAELNRFDL